MSGTVLSTTYEVVYPYQNPLAKQLLLLPPHDIHKKTEVWRVWKLDKNCRARNWKKSWPKWGLLDSRVWAPTQVLQHTCGCVLSAGEPGKRKPWKKVKPEDKHFHLQIPFHIRWRQNWHIHWALCELLLLGFGTFDGNQPLQHLYHLQCMSFQPAFGRSGYYRTRRSRTAAREVRFLCVWRPTCIFISNSQNSAYINV